MKLTANQFQDLVTLLNATSAASKHEKRREPRVTVRMPATIIPCEEPDRRLITVVVLDISAGGIGIASAISLEAARRFVLRISPRGSGLTLALQYSVAHSRKQSDGAFIIGAKFERVLTGADETPAPTPPQTIRATLDEVDADHLRHVETSLRSASLGFVGNCAKSGELVD